jgi:phycoerythrin-associated linker protein
MALWVSNETVELRSNATDHHVMDSQRVTSAESQLRNGDISVREFVRRVGQSPLYQSLFFENVSINRFVEVNCKHFLGRAPRDQAEISTYVQQYNNEGFDAVINAFVDSAEYLDRFGENTVPYATGAQTQAGQSNVGFNRVFAMMRGFASNTGKQAQLTSDLGNNLATKIAAPASISGGYTNTAKRFRIAASRTKSGGPTRNSNYSVEVGYAQLSARIQGIQRNGGRILSITEV